MFTGIIEELGIVRSVDPNGDGMRIVIESSKVLSDVRVGASIAVNGCCLTVVEFGDDWWSADVVPETLDRTNLAALVSSDAVNLERPMAADGRFGGHIVQGHIDATTELTSIDPLDGGSRRLSFLTTRELDPYLVEKGSVTIDGISLTVAKVEANSFDVAVIPHTLEHTTLGQRSIGAIANIEVDCIAKFVERLVSTGRVPTTGGGPQ